MPVFYDFFMKSVCFYSAYRMRDEDAMKNKKAGRENCFQKQFPAPADQAGLSDDFIAGFFRLFVGFLAVSLSTFFRLLSVFGSSIIGFFSAFLSVFWQFHYRLFYQLHCQLFWQLHWQLHWQLLWQLLWQLSTFSDLLSLRQESSHYR